MFGFFIAGLSTVGLVLLASRRHRRSPLGWAMRRLDASPAQEKVIREATSDMRSAFIELRKEGRESKAELASALREENFDRSRIEAWIEARKEALDHVSPRMIAAAEEMHATLDGQQRNKLSRWLERGGFHHRHHLC